MTAFAAGAGPPANKIATRRNFVGDAGGRESAEASDISKLLTKTKPSYYYASNFAGRVKPTDKRRDFLPRRHEISPY